MRILTVAELLKLITENLASGSLLLHGEIIVGFDSGSCAVVRSAGPNPAGELYLDTGDE